MSRPTYQQFLRFTIGIILTTGIAACSNTSTALPTTLPSATLPQAGFAIVQITDTYTPTLAKPTPTPSPTSTLTGISQATPDISGPSSKIPLSPATETAVPTPEPTPTNPASLANDSALTQSPPLTRTVRIGLNGRNDIGFHDLDYQLIREARIETLKMMSLTQPEVFARLRQENPDIEFIVRLYDDRMSAQGHPSPAEFAGRMTPIMAALQPYTTKFEVGNEPNHFQRYEGWGPEDADAENFNTWFLELYDLLKAAHPWAELGFPALGTPDSVHRDRAWLEINREAIERADWLGVHCYWQTPPNQPSTMFEPERGLCFTYYHAMFPDKPIELTEFDNDNIVYGYPPDSEENIARQYVAYYQELFKYPYLRSASSYIISSPDPAWDYFAWRSEDGRFKPVVSAVAKMPRPVLAR